MAAKSQLILENASIPATDPWYATPAVKGKIQRHPNKFYSIDAQTKIDGMTRNLAQIA